MNIKMGFVNIKVSTFVDTRHNIGINVKDTKQIPTKTLIFYFTNITIIIHF